MCFLLGLCVSEEMHRQSVRKLPIQLDSNIAASGYINLRKARRGEYAPGGRRDNSVV